MYILYIFKQTNYCQHQQHQPTPTDDPYLQKDIYITYIFM